MKKVLFIVAQINEETTSFNSNLKEASKDNWDLSFSLYKHIFVEVSNKEGKIKFELKQNNISLSEYEYVYIRNWINEDQEIAAVIATYCKYKNIPFDDEQLLFERHDGKLFQMCLLAINDIPIPKTIFINIDDLDSKYEFLTNQLGNQFIMKNSKLNHGEQNYLIQSKEMFKTIVGSSDVAATLIFQEFIENEFEYRYLVFGGKTAVVIKRNRPKGATTHRNNGEGMEVEYIQDESLWTHKEVAEKIAKLMRRDVVAVDILISSDLQNYYILEANPAPGMAVEEEQDKIKVNKFVEYINRQIRGNN